MNDTYINSTPKMIAYSVFNSEPKTAPPVPLIAFDQNNSDPITVFEILITVLLEGLVIFTNEFNINNFTEDHINNLKPWFIGLGFDLHVDSCPISDKKIYDEYYCRTVLKCHDENLFILKNIQEPYHFLLNGSALEKNKQKTELDELYGIFTIANTVYIVSFYIHMEDDATCGVANMGTIVNPQIY